jgi:quaternary ammonium compound-resistance protein SugE
MSWLILFIAGLCEVGWAVGLKFSAGFSHPWPAIGTVTAMILSIVLLGFAMRSLPVGIAYAVWTGIGAVGTVILGIFIFKEPATALRMTSVSLIILGIVGLKLSS